MDSKPPTSILVQLLPNSRQQSTEFGKYFYKKIPHFRNKAAKNIAKQTLNWQFYNFGDFSSFSTEDNTGGEQRLLGSYPVAQAGRAGGWMPIIIIKLF